MKKLLLLNACMNRKTSRTYRLCKELITLLNKDNGFEITELILEELNLQALTSETLNIRGELLKKGDLSDESFKYARQFSNADYIVVAAPLWDCGFPGIFKNYVEAISIPGIVSLYEGNGKPTGLCKAEKLYYVTTRGGSNIGDEKDLGFATILGLCKFFGIKDVRCISAEGLDDVDKVEYIMQKAIEAIPAKL